MTYDEAIEYIHSVSWRGSRPGLSRIEELCRLIGDPQDKLRFVHVAGTNGKGSFCCMLAEVLRASGYKTGLFTSPFVQSFCERMRVDGQNIDGQSLADVTEFVRQYADKMDDPPTEFELITAIAFEYFRREEGDIVVLEVGLGGWLDSTNIINTPILSVITEISLDHTAFLGDTVEKIAAEKAGIIKDGVPVLFTGTDARARSVIDDAAKGYGSRVYTPDYGSVSVTLSSVRGSRFDYGEERDYEIPLAGTYQPRNAAAVIEAARILKSIGYRTDEEAIRRGLASAVWHARFELLCDDPVIIYDGGHNPQGVSAAFDSIATYFPGERITALSGVMADKDVAALVETSSPFIAHMYTVKPDNPRALDAGEYAGLYASHGVPVTPCASVREGVAAAIADAKENSRPLFIFGSLYLYAEAAEAVADVAHGCGVTNVAGGET